MVRGQLNAGRARGRWYDLQGIHGLTCRPLERDGGAIDRQYGHHCRLLKSFSMSIYLRACLDY
jgi:hypothetical protein